VASAVFLSPTIWIRQVRKRAWRQWPW